MVSPEWTAWDEGGREGKAPKKGAKFTLHGVTKRDLAVPVYTATGLPAVSSVVLRSLAGRPGAAREIVDTWDALTDAEKTNDALKKSCGAAYDAFGGGYDGAEACAAVDALNDVAAIDTLLSNFIIPLQSDNLRGENRQGAHGAQHQHGDGAPVRAQAEPSEPARAREGPVRDSKGVHVPPGKHPRRRGLRPARAPSARAHGGVRVDARGVRGWGRLSLADRDGDV